MAPAPPGLSDPAHSLEALPLSWKAAVGVYSCPGLLSELAMPDFGSPSCFMRCFVACTSSPTPPGPHPEFAWFHLL